MPEVLEDHSKLNASGPGFPVTQPETHLWLVSSVNLKPPQVKFFFTLFCCAVLKLLKMATGMRALLDTVVQALPQVNTCPSFARSKEWLFFFFCFAGTSSRWVSHLCHSMLAWHVHMRVSVVFTLGRAESSQTAAASAACWKQQAFLKQLTVHLMVKSMFVWVF